jgi:hypothetical protein
MGLGLTRAGRGILLMGNLTRADGSGGLEVPEVVQGLQFC